MLEPTYINQDKLKLAQEDLDTALKIDPTFPNALALQISLLIDQGKFKEAKVFADQQIKKWPNRWQSYLGFGDVMVGLQDHASASNNYKKAVELEPSSPVAYSLVGKYFESQNNIDEAERTYDLGVKKFPNDIQLLINEGEILIQLNKLEMANERVLKALELSNLQKDSHHQTKLLEMRAKILDKKLLMSQSQEIRKNNPEAFKTSKVDAEDKDFEIK